VEIYMSNSTIYSLSLPLPYSLKQVTVYIVKADNRLTIIDTGLHTNETSEIWRQFFQKNRWNWDQVEKIIVTHYHPDHYGFAGKLQEWSGAPLYMAREEFERIQFFWNPVEKNSQELAAFFFKYGFPTDQLAELTNHMEGFRLVIEPHPQDFHWIGEGDSIQIAKDTYKVVKTPGHSEGHLSFLQADGTFFAGDVILPKITPNIPLLPHGDINPLATFFATLDRLKTLDIQTVYPAHGDAFEGIEQRIGEIKTHHFKRLNKIYHILGDNKWTGFQVCEQLFANRKLDIHNLRFAFSETLAHLEYLRQSDAIEQCVRDNVYYYFQ
jgi:glyoxylase-like metal-dependent hydrolase (beta-lactamase superfamily II)